MRLLLLLLVVPLVNCGRTVNTNSGPVRGFSVTGKKVEAFLGIPYAEPPVGERRFAKPVPISPWKETYDAKEFPPACAQVDIGEIHIPIEKPPRMSEDCLHLNLWVPEGGSKQKTIMLWIHGGGFMVGTSSMKNYDGAALAEHGDVIVASINYRVGTLGFFAGLIDEAPGSVGMYDQVMAIKWIKDNAKHFGGDPDNIVLFGESAGSFSVSLHLISPLSRNLFKRGILLSGSAFFPMYSEDNKVPLMFSQVAASAVGCASDDQALTKNPKEVVDCLKRLPTEKILEADQVLYKTSGIVFPRVGDDFLPKTPIDLYRSGNFKDDEVLMGVDRDEGSFLMTLLQQEGLGVFGEKVDAQSLDENSAKEFLPPAVRAFNLENILQSYFARVKESSRYTYLDAVRDLTGDFIINCGVVFQAEYQSAKNVPVYFYLFDYRPASSPLADWMGVTHFDEVQYVFGNPMYEGFTEFEKELSRDVMDMFVAFAKTGNPNIPGELKWPRYTAQDPKYYTISQRDAVGVRPDNYRCEAWRKAFRAV